MLGPRPSQSGETEPCSFPTGMHAKILSTWERARFNHQNSKATFGSGHSDLPFANQASNCLIATCTNNRQPNRRPSQTSSHMRVFIMRKGTEIHKSLGPFSSLQGSPQACMPPSHHAPPTENPPETPTNAMPPPAKPSKSRSSRQQPTHM